MTVPGRLGCSRLSLSSCIRCCSNENRLRVCVYICTCASGIASNTPRNEQQIWITRTWLAIRSSTARNMGTATRERNILPYALLNCDGKLQGLLRSL
ncbi:hypothetical protein BDV09DRAFT_2827 [Aspergillus tetrazonus]